MTTTHLDRECRGGVVEPGDLRACQGGVPCPWQGCGVVEDRVEGGVVGAATAPVRAITRHASLDKGGQAVAGVST